MDGKTIKILTGIFLALLFLAAIPWISGKISENKTADSRKNSSLDFSDFSEKSVEKIIIKNNSGEESVLSLQEGRWMIDDSEADKQKVADFFSDLDELNIKEMVSQEEANQNKFGVDKEMAIKMIITKKGQDSVFLVGRTGRVPGQFYLRKDGIKNTYLVESALREKLLWEASKWKKVEEKSDAAPEV